MAKHPMSSRGKAYRTPAKPPFSSSTREEGTDRSTYSSSTRGKSASAGVGEIPDASSAPDDAPSTCSAGGGDSCLGKYPSLRAQVYERWIK